MRKTPQIIKALLMDKRPRTVRQIANEIESNLTTVRQALHRLMKKGDVYMKGGKGKSSFYYLKGTIPYCPMIMELFRWLHTADIPRAYIIQDNNQGNIYPETYISRSYIMAKITGLLMKIEEEISNANKPS